ncbi:MFS transporter [Alphaproteobacteria bacterium GH1-50]|uniref:Lysosomal dipeptide transporter MFSD1 n=1 Tax=Kangsaoukella pontilimi TaxID=2691042 RepID=A0A7C9MZ68_9RHOB|nr:MFS transporter [Kangsaoukella pontilimi]MXQ07238.1 MFS transporter [Kangsaoukella pontilimi]
MSNRWSALALLFLARTVMAFQFQTVAALSPFLRETFGIGLGAVGFLLGLYMTPGLLLAIPGGALANRIGEKRIVILSLILMAAGFLIMALVPGWTATVAGRLMAGVGGVVMNIVMTKMVADWFEGREIATAMSIFVMSWPAGIALALVLLPPVAGASGLSAALMISALLAGLAALLFFGYAPAPGASDRKAGFWAGRRTVAMALVTGGAWGTFNGALAVVFGFGVALLTSRGMEVEAAGRVTSLTMVALAIIGPLGGIVADRTGRYVSLIVVCVLAMTALLGAMAAGGSSLWLFIGFGAACGLSAGPVMGLAGLLIPREERAAGMGLFFTVYYASMLTMPVIAGWASDVAGRPEAAFVAGMVFSALTIGILALIPAARRA